MKISHFWTGGTFMGGFTTAFNEATNNHFYLIDSLGGDD